MVPHRFEGLGQDACRAEHGHEVCVAAPARDDVLVEVFGDSGSGGFAQVDTNIEAVGVERLLENLFSLEGGLGEAEQLFVAKVL